MDKGFETFTPPETPKPAIELSPASQELLANLQTVNLDDEQSLQDFRALAVHHELNKIEPKDQNDGRLRFRARRNGLELYRILVQQCILFAKMYEAGKTDELTGLYNRDPLMIKVRTMIDDAKNQHHPIAAICIDLNGLKGLNDKYGHATGDKALATAGEVIAKALSVLEMHSSIAGRTGGDEFYIWCAKQDVHLTDEACAYISEQMSNTTFPAPDGERDIVLRAPSMGTAVWNPGDDFEPDELSQRADVKMYDDKNNYYQQTGQERRI